MCECVTYGVLIDTMADVKSIRLNRCCSEIRFHVCVFIFNFAFVSSDTRVRVSLRAQQHASHSAHTAHTLVFKSLPSQDKRCCCGQRAAVIRLLSHTHNKCWDVSVEKCDWRRFVKDIEEEKR